MIVATWSSTMSVYYRLIRNSRAWPLLRNSGTAISIRTDVFDSARRDDRAKLTRRYRARERTCKVKQSRSPTVYIASSSTSPYYGRPESISRSKNPVVSALEPCETGPSAQTNHGTLRFTVSDPYSGFLKLWPDRFLIPVSEPEPRSWLRTSSRSRSCNRSYSRSPIKAL